jgi:hypothetical protein
MKIKWKYKIVIISVYFWMSLFCYYSTFFWARRVPHFLCNRPTFPDMSVLGSDFLVQHRKVENGKLHRLGECWISKKIMYLSPCEYCYMLFLKALASLAHPADKVNVLGSLIGTYALTLDLMCCIVSFWEYLVFVRQFERVLEALWIVYSFCTWLARR